MSITPYGVGLEYCIMALTQGSVEGVITRHNQKMPFCFFT